MCGHECNRFVEFYDALIFLGLKQMNCYISAIVGIALLGATFSTMTVSPSQHEQLRARFSADVAARYDRIVRERRNLYLQGLILGLVVSLGASRWMLFVTPFHRVTFALAVTLFVTVAYYTLMPKSDFMLLHLQNASENAAWLDMYKTMKRRYVLGIVLGALAAIPLAYAWCPVAYPPAIDNPLGFGQCAYTRG
jgi:hypothetical protein